MVRMRTVWLNGEFVAADAARISIFDRGLLFGQAVYEVAPVVGGRIANWPRHAARLADSLETAMIADATDWPPILAELIARNALDEGRVYLQVTGGSQGDRDFAQPQPMPPPNRFAFTQTADMLADPRAESGLSVILRPDLRWGLRAAKTTQLLYALRMKEEARIAGADDVWMIENGMITEATSQNAHIVDARGVLVTHPVQRRAAPGGVLPGITRMSVIDIAAAQGIAIEERAFSPEELFAAHEAFVSAAGSLVLPVTRVDGRAIGDGRPGPITRTLRTRYIEALRGG